LSIVDDAPATAHRFLRGIFADAQAVVVFDHEVAMVMPTHMRCIRTYERRASPLHARIIDETIRGFARMRRFRAHPPGATPVVSFLNEFLASRCYRG